MTTAPTPLDDTALPAEVARAVADPKTYATPQLYETFAWMRANNPLGVARADGFDPFWVVTKHADILEISRNNSLFHNGDRQAVLTTQEADRTTRQITGGSPHLVRSLVQMDEPDHLKYRALTQAWFMPQNLKKLEARIREIARGFVDRMADMPGGECDFVADVALHFPLHVIMEILGVPESDEPRMLKLTQELFGASDPELGRGAAAPKTAEEQTLMLQTVVADFFGYFQQITDDRRAHPREDVASAIANGRIDGAELGPMEAMSYYVIVATAGHDTTSSSTAGAAWALCDNPDQWRLLKGDLSLIPGLVDESIRWTTPVKHFMRSATADTELRGRRIARGDWLMLAYASGNRDEEVFEQADRFRIDRKPNRHLAFGYGAHLCLGQHLAKMEMRILWEELLPRLASLELAGAPKMSQSAFVNGPKTLPVRFTLN